MVKGAKARSRMIFAPVPLVRVVYSVLLALMIALIALASRTGAKYDRTVGFAVGTFFALFAVVTWPKAVWLTDVGLRQRCWYGVWRSITWSAVTRVKQTRNGSVAVWGN